MADEVVVDVVCVGSGGGGLGAGITAADAGADVLVAERSTRIGGTLAYSGGQVWVGASHVAAEAGIEDSLEETTTYLDFLSEGASIAELRDAFVQRGPEALRYFTDRGVALQVIRGLPDYYYPKAPGAKFEGRYHDIEPYEIAQLGDLVDLVDSSPHGGGVVTSQDRIDAGGQMITEELLARRAAHLERGERCGGAGLAASLAKAAADRGVRFQTSSRVVRLVAGDGGVEGVVVQGPEGETVVRARGGVVLATGSYDRNPELMRQFEHLGEVKSMAPAGITGDHFYLAGDLGASAVVVRPPHAGGTMYGFHTPGELQDDKPMFRTFMPGLPHAILVNRHGARFCNDGFYPDVIAGMAREDTLVDGPANWPTWLIVDQSYRDKYMLGSVPPGQPLPDGMAVTGATVREVAEAAGIDAAGLEETVARFNGYCETGVDEEFDRGSMGYASQMFGDRRMPNPNLGALDKSPYTAIKLTRIAMATPSAGLRIDGDAAVQTVRGNPIPGLYAVGNAAAQLDIGAGYNSGMGNMRALLYGYLAARAIASR